jgi:hypothetical protein
MLDVHGIVFSQGRLFGAAIMEYCVYQLHARHGTMQSQFVITVQRPETIIFSFQRENDSNNNCGECREVCPV